MPYMKDGIPFLYDETTKKIVGVKESDGGESLFLISRDDSLSGGKEVTIGVSRYGLSSQLYPVNGQIKWGSYGDSIANVSSFANFDLRQASVSVGVAGERMGSWVGALTNGLFRLSANCGVSGETTAQMLSRESAGASATRKSIVDAASTGVQYLVNSFGINDIQTLSAGASSSTIDSVVAAAIANAVTILKKQKANGIWPVTHSLLGYSYTSASAGEISARREGVQRFNEILGGIILAADGALGSWVDVYSMVTDGLGGWRTGYDQGDGLHPSANGCSVIYRAVADEMMCIAGVSNKPDFAYGLQTNIFSNPDFSSSSGGQATNVNIYAVGTATLSKSINEWRGKNWQDCLVTPTALDGNGNAGVTFDITLTNTGIATNDVIGGEVSVYIDDGSGGAPSVFQHLVRLRANTAYSDTPLYNPTVSPKVDYVEPIDYRVAMLPIVSPSATPATFLITVTALAQSLTPFRVRVALPRAFELPITY